MCFQSTAENLLMDVQVEEFLPMGSMLDFLEEHPEKVRVEYELYLWAAQIARGMMYLESKRLVHRDLAARNILLASLQKVRCSVFCTRIATGQLRENLVLCFQVL